MESKHLSTCEKSQHTVNFLQVNPCSLGSPDGHPVSSLIPHPASARTGLKAPQAASQEDFTSSCDTACSFPLQLLPHQLSGTLGSPLMSDKHSRSFPNTAREDFKSLRHHPEKRNLSMSNQHTHSVQWRALFHYSRFPTDSQSPGLAHSF